LQTVLVVLHNTPVNAFARLARRDRLDGTGIVVTTFEIEGRLVGKGRCFIIGEVAQNHDGSLGLAHAFIDVIADSGADAVKFQTHIAAAESTASEPWRVKFSPQDATRYDYWKRMEFREEQWGDLAAHARRRGLVFLSSPFSEEAVELLARVGVPAWKVASGEVGSVRMIERMSASRLPFLLSTGMSSLDEIDRSVNQIKRNGLPLAVLQCTSEYPCPPEKLGLNLLTFFRQRYECPAGLSDHSGTIYAGLAAAAVGAAVLEVHVTLSREMFGPDVSVSVTASELARLVEGVRFIEKAMANPVDKDALSGTMQPLRDAFTKSVVARVPLKCGTVLRTEHLATRKPGTGIPASRLPELIGRRVQRDMVTNELLREEDLEEVSG